MTDKNRYLHNLGVRLLLCNRASWADTKDTLQDYEEMMDASTVEGECLQQPPSTLESPKDVASALWKEKIFHQKTAIIGTAILGFALLLWLFFVTAFADYPFRSSEIACVAIFSVCLMGWLVLRCDCLCMLPVLTHKRLKITVLHLLSLVINLSFALLFYNWLHIDPYISAKYMPMVGPLTMVFIYCIFFFELGMGIYGIYGAIRHNPYCFSLFVHCCGSIVFLYFWADCLKDLYDFNQIPILLAISFIPYVFSALLSLITLFLVRFFSRKGETLWMHK